MGAKNNCGDNICGRDFGVLGAVIPGQFGGANAFGFATGEVLGNLKDCESVFELGSLAALHNLHARSRRHARQLLGLPCFQDD